MKVMMRFSAVLGLLGVLLLFPMSTHAASFATGVALSAYSGCTSPAGLDISMNTDATITHEGGIATTSAGTVLMSFDQSSGFASYSGTFTGYNFASPAWSVPNGTIVGLYAYIGSLPYNATTTVEWFVAYRCDTQEIVLSCFGVYGSCPQSAADLGVGASGLSCENVNDGRLNNSSARDCAAPVVLYLQAPGADGIARLDIYGVGSGSSSLAVSVPSTIWEIGAPANDKTLIDFVGNPNNGQPIGVYLMLDGTVLIETAYADGKPYVIRYDPDGAPQILYAAW